MQAAAGVLHEAVTRAVERTGALSEFGDLDTGIALQSNVIRTA